MTSDTSAMGETRLRVCVIGCGAIAEQFHLPVLHGHPNVQLAALVERDHARLNLLADKYQVELRCADQSELDFEQIDAAILATPPAYHAPGCIDLLMRGKHVLVEKPMATSLVDARKMCQIAEERGVQLAVGVYKRLLPSIQLIKSMILSQQFGKLRECTMDWGGFGAYGSATLGLMKKEAAGGGVLMDLGPHVLDILTELIGPHAKVISYCDDARGGIEADCIADIEFCTEWGKVPVRINLSRTRKLDRGFELRFEQATCQMPVNERFEVKVSPQNGMEPFVLRSANVDVNASWFEPFRVQLDDWLAAIFKKKALRLSGSSCLPAMEIIETCYTARKPLRLPWLLSSELNCDSVGAIKSVPRVLVTGAGGFVGGRTAEMLYATGRWNIRAHVRRPSSASRIARLPVEIVQGDLKVREDVDRMLAGCDAVVHCAVGTDYGQNQSIYEVTVEGTKRLVDKAVERGVKRFVHISSIAVHDANAHDVIDSDTPLINGKQDWYGHTKVLAERVVLSQSERLSSVIIRPGCVYGPHGFTFVINPLQALMQGRLVLVGAENSPSNSVHVDNLAEAIRLAVESTSPRAAGSVIVIGDDENWTWGQYYDYFASRIGKEVRRVNEVAVAPAKNRAGNSRSFRKALTSPEAFGFAKRILQTDPLGTLPRWTLEKFPQSEKWVKAALGLNATQTYVRPSSTVGADVKVTPRRGKISLQRAIDIFAYKPTLSRAQAMRQTFEWAQYAGILPITDGCEAYGAS
jgi:predicted dehydrogenase/nucleoside-diphosphate-sugar epimerase